LAVQLEKLKACDKIFKEKRSGVDAGRPELKACLDYLREGDTLLVTKLDRLARSTPRQQEGINKAKAEGVRFGPKPLLTEHVVEKIKQLRAEGLTVPEIMRRTKLSKASVYRALA
jgi:DNA invertase Pin-like site-specific DNA recombinase